MAQKPRTSVILNDQAREILKNDCLQIFIKDGFYFNCDSVEQNGYFMDMTISFSQAKVQIDYLSHLTTIISIPTHFILYMVSGEARKKLGFSDD